MSIRHDWLIRYFDLSTRRFKLYLTAIECTVFVNGNQIYGENGLAGRIGDLPCTTGVTYANFIFEATSLDSIRFTLCELLKICAVAYDPTEIYITSAKFKLNPEFIAELKYSLYSGMLWGKKKPEIHSVYNQSAEAMGAITSRGHFKLGQ